MERWSAMRIVTATWTNDEGEPVYFTVEMSDMAIHDLIRFMEEADCDEKYQENDFAR
jgi:hypothetical protein